MTTGYATTAHDLGDGENDQEQAQTFEEVATTAVQGNHQIHTRQ